MKTFYPETNPEEIEKILVKMQFLVIESTGIVITQRNSDEPEPYCFHYDSITYEYLIPDILRVMDQRTGRGVEMDFRTVNITRRSKTLIDFICYCLTNETTSLMPNEQVEIRQPR